MNSIPFESFAEKMDHEFTGTELKIEKIGYKVDGKGIKTHCSCSTLKSVDYFHQDENKVSLIEFSDLHAQHTQISCKIEKLNASDMEKADKRLFIKEQYKIIPQEMRKKYIDSIHILKCMNGKISEIPEWAMAQEKGKYIIVVAPISELAPPEQRAEVIRMLDNLQNNLALSIPDPLFDGVSVIPLTRFLS